MAYRVVMPFFFCFIILTGCFQFVLPMFLGVLNPHAFCRESHAFGQRLSCLKQLPIRLSQLVRFQIWPV